MIESTSVCVNLVPYEEGTKQDGAQHAAYQSLELESFQNVSVAALEVDLPALMEKYPGVEFCCLPRDAKEYVGGPRNLPFVKDMIEQAYKDGRPDTYWIGMINSDIVATGVLTKRLDELASLGKDGIIIHRTDVASLDDYPEDGNVLNIGVDGFFVSVEMWERFRHSYPDWVLGEPGWGQGTELWMKFHNLKFEKLCNHECVHVRHRAFWKKQRTAVFRYNRRLYDGVKFLLDGKNKV